MEIVKRVERENNSDDSKDIKKRKNSKLYLCEYAKLCKINVRSPLLVVIALNKIANKRKCNVSIIINEAFASYLEHKSIDIYNINVRKEMKDKFNEYIKSCKSSEFLLFYINYIKDNLNVDIDDETFEKIVEGFVDRLYSQMSVIPKRQIVNLLKYQKENSINMFMKLFQQDYVKNILKEGREQLLQALGV